MWAVFRDRLRFGVYLYVMEKRFFQEATERRGLILALMAFGQHFTAPERGGSGPSAA